MSRNQAYSLLEKWGGRDFLMPIDIEMVQEIKQTMGGDSILEFNLAEFSEKAQEAYNTLGLNELSFLNVWEVYSVMKQLLFTS